MSNETNVIYVVQNNDDVLMAVCSCKNKARSVQKLGHLAYKENWTIEKTKLDTIPDWLYNELGQIGKILKEFHG